MQQAHFYLKEFLNSWEDGINAFMFSKIIFKNDEIAVA